MTVPYFPIKPPAKPAVTETLDITRVVNSSGYQEWQVNNRAYHGDYNDPILLLASEKNYSYPDSDPGWNVYNFGTASSVRLILNNDSEDNTNLSHVSVLLPMN